MGESLPDSFLLTGDHLGGGVADRQTAAEPVGFDVVVDQHGAAVLIAGQAVQRQAEDVLGPAPGVDPDLGGGPDLGGLKGVQVGAQDRHDLRRQVTAGFAAFGIGRDVGAFDGDITGQPGRDRPARVRPRPRIPASTARTSRQIMFRR